MQDAEIDDTTPRHEIRWYVAYTPPATELVTRVREALARMSPAGAQYERNRIAELVPAWAKALEEAEG